MIYWVNQYLVAPDSPGGTRHVEFANRLCQLGLQVELLGADLNLGTRRYTRRKSRLDHGTLSEQVGQAVIRWLYTTGYTTNDWRRAYSMLRFGFSAFGWLMRAPVPPRSTFIGSSPHLLAALATELASRLRGARFVLEIRDLWPETMVELLGRETPLTRALRVIADYLYARADRIIVLARGSIDAIAARGVPPERCVYVPNGVEPSLFRTKGEDHREEFGLPTEGIVAIYAGAHGPANALETLVEAARILRERRQTGVHLALFGDGPAKLALSQLVADTRLDNVTLHPPVAKSAIPMLLSSCDVGLLTLRDAPVFRYGVSPNKLFDYMAAGLPVLSNVQGECADIVRQADCGSVVPPDGAAAMADILTTWRDAPDTRARLGDRGRSYVEAHFARDKLARRLAVALAPGLGHAQ